MGKKLGRPRMPGRPPLLLVIPHRYQAHYRRLLLACQGSSRLIGSVNVINGLT